MFTKLRVLCRTLAGNNVHYLTVTEPCQEEDPKVIFNYILLFSFNCVLFRIINTIKSYVIAKKSHCFNSTCTSI